MSLRAANATSGSFWRGISSLPAAGRAYSVRPTGTTQRSVRSTGSWPLYIAPSVLIHSNMELSFIKTYGGLFDILGPPIGSLFKNGTTSDGFRYRDGEYIGEFELAGVRRDDVEVSREGRSLTVAWADRSGRKIARSFEFPSDAGLELASVGLKDGLLTIRVPHRRGGHERVMIPLSED